MEDRKGDPGAAEASRRMDHASDVRYYENYFFFFLTKVERIR